MDIIVRQKQVVYWPNFMARRKRIKTIISKHRMQISVINYLFLLPAFVLYEAGILGITAGAHRLWSHRSYKAKWPLRLILMLLHTLTFQVS
jgi:stearoyl-CoA desaturase (delta-9 desaturase)